MTSNTMLLRTEKSKTFKFPLLSLATIPSAFNASYGLAKTIGFLKNLKKENEYSACHKFLYVAGPILIVIARAI